MSLLGDTFTDSDGVLLTAHAMDTGSGWNLESGQGFEIQGNRAVTHGFAFGIGQLVSADAGVSNVTMAGTVRIKTGSRAGLAARIGGTAAAYLVNISETSLAIWRSDGFSNTEVAATAASLAADVDHSLTVTIIGSNIVGIVDGATQVSYGLATINSSSTRFGIWSVSGGGVPDQFDDFQVDSLPTATPTATGAYVAYAPRSMGLVAGADEWYCVGLADHPAMRDGQTLSNPTCATDLTQTSGPIVLSSPFTGRNSAGQLVTIAAGQGVKVRLSGAAGTHDVALLVQASGGETIGARFQVLVG